MNSNEKKKTLYILLTYTGTGFSKLIKLFTKAKYTHVSIALDKDFEELYSFGRKIPHIPIFAGFVKENHLCGVYSVFSNTVCAVYSLEVTENQYEKVENLIEKFKQNKKVYRYNLLGLFAIMLKKPIKRKHHYFCSQFIATLLKESSIDILHKTPELVIPTDFIENRYLNLIYTGKLSNYNSFSYNC